MRLKTPNCIQSCTVYIFLFASRLFYLLGEFREYKLQHIFAHSLLGSPDQSNSHNYLTDKKSFWDNWLWIELYASLERNAVCSAFLSVFPFVAFSFSPLLFVFLSWFRHNRQSFYLWRKRENAIEETRNSDLKTFLFICFDFWNKLLRIGPHEIRTMFQLETREREGKDRGRDSFGEQALKGVSTFNRWR